MTEAGPAPRRITVCTLAIGTVYQDIVRYSIEGMRAYCERHGYRFVLDTGEAGNTVFDGERAPTWYKLPLLQKCLADCDYAVWIDVDSHILKPEVKLESFIERYMGDRDMLFGKEGRSDVVLNGGVVFVRSTPWAHAQLGLAWSNEGKFDPGTHEQASLGDLWTRNVAGMRDRVVILGPNLQNEFLSYWFTYYPGQCFIVHATRCAHDREGFVYTMDLFCPIRLRERDRCPIPRSHGLADPDGAMPR